MFASVFDSHDVEIEQPIVMQSLSETCADSVGIAGERDVEGPGRRQPIDGSRLRGVSTGVLKGARSAFRDRVGAGGNIDHIGKLRWHGSTFNPRGEDLN